MYLSEWAEQGNISQDNLKRLELEFLYALNWNLYVSNCEFFAKLKHIEEALARQQGLLRGWLTYTELSQLIPSLSIAKAFIQYTSVFLVSYAASVFTIAGAFLVASQIPGSALYSCTKSSTIFTQTKHTIQPEIHTSTSNQTNVLLSNIDENDSNSTQPDQMDEILNRLKFQLEDDESSVILRSDTFKVMNERIGSIFPIHIPDKKITQNCSINRSGINLRSFLDADNEDALLVTDVAGSTNSNFSNFETTMALNIDSNSCKAGAYSLSWMKFI